MLNTEHQQTPMITPPREILSRILGSIARGLLACSTFAARLQRRVGFSIHSATNEQIIEYKYSVVGRYERDQLRHLQTAVYDRVANTTTAALDEALWEYDATGQDLATKDYYSRIYLSTRQHAVEHLASLFDLPVRLDPVAAPGHDTRTRDAQTAETLLTYLYHRAFCSVSRVELFQLCRDAGLLTKEEIDAVLERHPGFNKSSVWLTKASPLGGTTHVSQE